MGFVYEERSSDSPFLETVTRGYTDGAGSTVRPAECHWHMVLVNLNGIIRLLVVGPLSSAGVVSYGPGAELLWIKFKLGVFMPHLPTRDILDSETMLPVAASNSFWLKGSAWQFPDYDNVEIFISRLVQEEVLACDPVIKEVIQGRPADISPRTVRHRFLRATGLAGSQIWQMQRAQAAATRLQQGASILDTVFEAGYYDQPHLTRSLKRWIGYTPSQIAQAGQS